MKRFYIVLFSALLLAGSHVCSAQSIEPFQPEGRLELSAGWGDQLFEKVVWHKKGEVYGLLPESKVINVNEDYKYSQHWFVNANYKLTDCIGVGAMVDVSGVSWINKDYNGKGVLLQENGKHSFSNIVVMQTASFNYMTRRYVSLHSGLGLGLNVNTGTETDYLGNKTECAFAMYLNPIGIRGTYGRYFASFDLGAMISLKGMNEVYMLGSRLFSVSVGIKL